MMQQIRNQKRTKTKAHAIKVNLNDLFAKMYLVKPVEPEQQISLWLMSKTAEIAPIRVFLLSKFDGDGLLLDHRLYPPYTDSR